MSMPPPVPNPERRRRPLTHRLSDENSLDRVLFASPNNVFRPPSPAPSPRKKGSLRGQDGQQYVPLDEWMTPAVQEAGLIITHVINEGSFGTVLKGRKYVDGSVLAVKVVKKSGLSEREQASMRKQAITLRTLRHRYIAEFYDDFEDEEYFYHVFEYLQGGDLYDRLEARGKPFSEAQVLFLARQMFYAVSYLHSKRAAHRDIKLENFVFETIPSDRRQVMKLIDFDLLVMRSASAPAVELCNDICGTIYYVSPEIASERQHVPEQSDMWACGVMLYVLLTYHMPFQGNTNRETLKAVRSTEVHFNPAVWAFISNETRSLVKDLLNKNGNVRPTALEALDRVKAIQANHRDSHNSSKLRSLTRGLRSVSLNVWDPAGRIARRPRGSQERRPPENAANTRRSHSNFPGEESVSGSEYATTSFVPHSVTDSEAESAPTLLDGRGPSQHSLFGRGPSRKNGTTGIHHMKDYQREQLLEGSRISSDYHVSPIRDPSNEKRRVGYGMRGKNDIPELQAISPMRSSRRVRKQSKLAMRIRNWIHFGSGDHGR